MACSQSVSTPDNEDSAACDLNTKPVPENEAVYSPSLDTLAEWPASGFYAEPFVVSFPENAAARCETGGLAPTENSPLAASFQIDSTVTIRCASFMENALPGKELMRTYVFDSVPAIAAVFLTADPNSLFDPDTGIYMEGNFASSEIPYYGANYWLDKEIPVYVELLELGKTEPAFSKHAGLKIFGNCSRQHDKKSVAITFREKYGDKRLHYSLFPEYPELNKFKSFVLRNNGSNFKTDYIRDYLASSISEGLGVDYQRGRFVVVYYNGEYFGIHSIRERSTEYYFETHYGMDPDKIDVVKADNTASAGSSDDYVALMNWLEDHTLESDENYAYVASQIDVGNFINYMLVEIYSNNRDWPGNNLKKWRNNSPKSPWKWFLYDLDAGFHRYIAECSDNTFEFASAKESGCRTKSHPYTLLLRRLLENESFKSSFVNRMAVLLQMNFESSRVLARIDAMMSEIELEIPRDQERWGHLASRMRTNLNFIKDFATSRPGVIFNELREYFGLGEKSSVTLSMKGLGELYVHGLKLDKTPMKVDFFKNFPVTITAESAGGVWVGWNDGVMERTRVIDPDSIDALTAVFK